MRIPLQFLGGVLVGFGLATFAFGVWLWIWMHHMFILGVTSWPALMVTMMLPLLLIVLGSGLALAGRNRGRQP